MIKRETYALLKRISVYYEQFVVSQEKVDHWHAVLIDESYEDVYENLTAYVKESVYPPKLSELLLRSASLATTPTMQETKKIIAKRPVPASEEVKQRELAKMRAILGIAREEAR